MRWIAAAAAVLILAILGGVIYLAQRPVQHQELVQTANKNEVQAGTGAGQC